ncbi:MAG: serine/threonine-protein phosphatase [Deltaproteobacteria bacterium]|nr:serine/threonine-protein phosphatase [Deltaproteobacteria bacterium]
MSGDAHRNGDDPSGPDEGGETMAPAPGQQSWSRSSNVAAGPTPEGLHFTVFGKTDVGLIREHNEDNFMAADLGDASGPLPAEKLVSGVVSDRGLALAVCDGMGGAAAGEVASNMAVDTLFEMMRGESASDDRDSFARRLVDSIEEAGARIFLSAKRDRTRRGMGTTATVAGLVDKVLFVGQVGDSRCYIMRNGRLSLITKDQSLVNQLIEAGQLTEEEAEAFEHSNIILQALGTTQEVAVDLTFVELRQGDRVLLCSDGLCGLVHNDAIQEEMACVGPLPELVDRLIELANAAGGHDNVTCIVADFDGDALEPPEEGTVPFYQQYPLPRGHNQRAAAGPTLPHVVKSMVPRAMSGKRPAIGEKGSDPPSTVPVSWSTAASVLALLGLAAVITIVSVRRRATPTAATVPPPPAYVEAAAQIPVEVRVLAALDTGELYVNDRSYGPLRLNQAILLRLLPGSYHFEAREVDGTRVAKDVLVEPGVPTEVVLIPAAD